MKVAIEITELSKKTLNRIAMETTDPDVLEQIAKISRSETVLTAVAGNEWTPRGTVIALSKSKSDRVKNAALKNLA